MRPRSAPLRALAFLLSGLSFAPCLFAQDAPGAPGRVLGEACTLNLSVPAPAPGPGPAPAQAGPPPFPQAATTSGEPTRLVEVRPDLYALVNATNNVMPDVPLYGGNVAIYLTDEGVVLIDSRTERMHEDLVAKVRSLTDAPIKYVVLTHNHADHSGGAARLQALGATVVSSAAERRRMANAGAQGLAQIAYEGHARIELGGKSMELFEVCGHTSGDTVVYLPHARVVISGDLVATPDSIPQITNYADGGSWTDMVNALDALATLDFDFLIAGHGPVLTRAEFLAHRDKIAAIRARAQELVRAGASESALAEALAREFNWGGPGPAAGNIAGMMVEFRAPRPL